MKFSAASSSGRLFAFLRTPVVNGFLVALAGLGGGAEVGDTGDIVKA